MDDLKKFIQKTWKELVSWVDDIVEALCIFYKNKPNPPPNDIPPEYIRRVTTIEEVSQTINYAVENGLTIRVLGSEHSAAGAILADPYTTKYLMLLLTGELRELEVINREEGIFRAGAGLHIGYNPDDRDKGKDDQSSWENSFAHRVDKEGFALSIVGGITQQTIGGFLSTGSAGGSLAYAFPENIIAIEYVDGQGNCRTVKRPSTNNINDLENDREWYALGVSMGLLGVITRVTFKLEPTFKVSGFEVYEDYEHSSLKQNGKYTVKENLADKEYFRAFWYPQDGVEKVNTWQGSRVSVTKETERYVNDLENKNKQMAAGASLLYLDDILCKDRTDFTRVAKIMNLQTPLGPFKEFVDKWYKIIPSDDEAPVDSLLKIVFSELWFPIDKCDEVMSILEQLFRTDKKACWNLPIEIYGAKKSPFWLSPAYKGDMVRVDVFWYFYNGGGAVTRDFHFQKFWRALINVEGITFHWGKHVPKVRRCSYMFIEFHQPAQRHHFYVTGRHFYVDTGRHEGVLQLRKTPCDAC